MDKNKNKQKKKKRKQQRNNEKAKRRKACVNRKLDNVCTQRRVYRWPRRGQRGGGLEERRGLGLCRGETGCGCVLLATPATHTLDPEQHKTADDRQTQKACLGASETTTSTQRSMRGVRAGQRKAQREIEREAEAVAEGERECNVRRDDKHEDCALPLLVFL